KAGSGRRMAGAVMASSCGFERATWSIVQLWARTSSSHLERGARHAPQLGPQTLARGPRAEDARAECDLLRRLVHDGREEHGGDDEDRGGGVDLGLGVCLPYHAEAERLELLEKAERAVVHRLERGPVEEARGIAVSDQELEEGV